MKIMIDEAITARVEEILEHEGFCTRSQSKEIAEEIADVVRGEFNHDIQEVSKELERLLKMNDRLWDAIHGIQLPRYPRLREFFKFRWLMFWRRWM